MPRIYALPWVVTLTVLAPLAAGHGAPDPPAWTTRILHDYNDDWGGHAAQKPGHDLLALDVQEAYNRTWGENVLVFRLLMDGGFSGASSGLQLRDVVSWSASDQASRFEVWTTDDRSFNGTFDGMGAPRPLLRPDGFPDGARFSIDGTVRFSRLGLAVGTKLSGFFVQGYAGPDAADHMVGGYSEGGRRIEGVPPSEEGDPVSYRRNDYVLRGPGTYLDSTLSANRVELQPMEPATVTWTLTDRMGADQHVTLEADAPPGVAVAFRGLDAGENLTSVHLGPGGQATFTVRVVTHHHWEAGSLGLAATTDLGGRNEHEVVLEAAAPRGASPGFPVTAGLLVAGLVGGLRRMR